MGEFGIFFFAHIYFVKFLVCAQSFRALYFTLHSQITKPNMVTYVDNEQYTITAIYKNIESEWLSGEECTMANASRYSVRKWIRPKKVWQAH